MYHFEEQDPPAGMLDECFGRAVAPGGKSYVLSYQTRDLNYPVSTLSIRWGDVGVLSNLCTLPQNRRMGFAKLAVRLAVDKFKDKTLIVYLPEESKLLHCFCTLGFVPVDLLFTNGIRIFKLRHQGLPRNNPIPDSPPSADVKPPDVALQGTAESRQLLLPDVRSDWIPGMSRKRGPMSANNPKD